MLIIMKYKLRCMNHNGIQNDKYEIHIKVKFERGAHWALNSFLTLFHFSEFQVIFNNSKLELNACRVVGFYLFLLSAVRD